MEVEDLNIRVMTEEDRSLGMRLSHQAGWNQTDADWRRFLMLSPTSCFVGQWEGVDIATTAIFRFGSVAWIAMVLVEQTHRGRGIGTHMMTHALAWCDLHPVQAVRLDATPLGRPLYEKLGFKVQYESTRFAGIAKHTEQRVRERVEASEGPSELIRLDTAMPDTDRGALLAAFWRENPDAIRVVRDQGYSVLRPGSKTIQIGPVIAANESAGLALLDQAVNQCDGRRIVVDIPLSNPPALEWAKACGLTPQRSLMRMQRGETTPDQVAHIFASSGPEKG